MISTKSEMTQEKIVLKHLLKHGKITPWEAIQKYRITRLGAIIYNLKKKGYNISSKLICKGKSRWSEYKLIVETDIFNNLVIDRNQNLD